MLGVFFGRLRRPKTPQKYLVIMKVFYVEDNPVDLDLTRRSLARQAPQYEFESTYNCNSARQRLDRIAKEITAPVKLTYLKDKLGQRVPNMKGDLLVIRANFTVKRSDYGINTAAPQDKVSDDIELALSIAGAAAH